MRKATVAASMTLCSPAVLGCRSLSEPQGQASTKPDASGVMDAALEVLLKTGPEYGGGLANHGPMAAEALVAMGRADAVMPWVERYKRRLQSYPQGGRPISRKDWQEALGDKGRVVDWAAFFDRELQEAPWRAALGAWATRLAPGLAAAAAHGPIRAAHAARSLAERETETRRRELAEGLGYWAANYQPLPMARGGKPGNLKPSQAIKQVASLPVERRGGGSIVGGLRRLDDFAPFAGVAGLVDCSGDASRFLADLTETFAGICLTSPRNIIAFIHAVTGPSALRLLLPYLPPEAKPSVLRYGWQAAAGIYAAFAVAPATTAIEEQKQERDDLIDRSIANGDEHAIKFTEACLREYAVNPKPVYLLAARHAIDRLPPA